MVGITLSPEQIRNAPQAVRRWLEQEIAAALNPQPEPAAGRRGAEHLIACGREEAAAILCRGAQRPAGGQRVVRARPRS